MHSFRSTGVMRTACQEGIVRTVGDPSRVRGRDPQQCFRCWPGRESERAGVPAKSRKRDGGKCPYFWHASEGDEEG